MHFPMKIAMSIGLSGAIVAWAGSIYFSRPVVKHLEPVQWVGSVPDTMSNAAMPARITVHTIPLRADWHDTVAISEATVSRAVGFSVIADYRLAQSKTVSGHWQRSWGIEGFPVYQGYRFQIWSHPLFGAAKRLGTGRAGRPIRIVWRVGPMAPPKPLQMVPSTP